MTNYYSYDLKEKIIELYNKSYSVKQLVELFNISKSSIYSWIKNNNLPKNKTKFIKINSLFHNHLIRINIKFYILKYPNFNYHKLIQYVKRKTTFIVSKSTLYNIIHSLNFKKKNIKFQKFYGRNINNRTKLSNIRKIIKNTNVDNIISIDEVSFDTNIINKSCWTNKLKKYKKICATYKRYTIICAINNKKILHYKIIKNSSKSSACY